MRGLLLTTLILTSCAGSQTIKRDQESHALGSKRPATIKIKGTNDIKGWDVVVGPKTVEYYDADRIRLNRIVRDSVVEIHIWNHQKGVLAGLWTGGFAGGVYKLSNGFPIEGENELRSATIFIQSFYLLVNIGCGAIVGSLAGYLIGYDEVYIIE